MSANAAGKHWTVIRRESELEALRAATRDPASPVRLMRHHGDPFESALLALDALYLAYREPPGASPPELLALARRPVRDDEVEVRRGAMVAVHLPPEYPDRPPAFEMLTPGVLNPAVLGPEVCLARGHRSDMMLVEVVVEQLLPLLRLVAGTFDPRRPLNPAAVDWLATQTAFALPLGGPQPAAPAARPRIRRIR